MGKILVSGLVNMETTVKVRQFPIPYYPIDYPFFGVNSAASGVAYNIAGALRTLGDEVRLASMTGVDFPAEYVKRQLESMGVETDHIKPSLRETAGSVVLYDDSGRRQIYCDLKDIQERTYGFPEDICADIQLVVACNINFNRELLGLAKAAGVPIATDVHVLNNVYDAYNRDFLEAADIVFLSDEGLGEDWRHFLWELIRVYDPSVLVLGRGGKGAVLYVRGWDSFWEMPAVAVGPVVNTVGAGDALFSAFVHYYAQGMAPADCLKRAQVFASAKIGVSGASKGFVDEGQIEKLYNEVYN